MTNTARTTLLISMLTVGLAGCDGAGPASPTLPAQPPVRPPAGLSAVLQGVTVFGIVSESTPTGRVAISDVSIYCDACGEFGHTWLRTDANGYYSFNGDLDAGGGIWLSADPLLPSSDLVLLVGQGRIPRIRRGCRPAGGRFG